CSISHDSGIRVLASSRSPSSGTTYGLPSISIVWAHMTTITRSCWRDASRKRMSVCSKIGLTGGFGFLGAPSLNSTTCPSGMRNLLGIFSEVLAKSAFRRARGVVALPCGVGVDVVFATNPQQPAGEGCFPAGDDGLVRVANNALFWRFLTRIALGL